MQIKLKELLENMTGEGGGQPAPADADGVVATAVEDGPSVASACPPTPKRSNSSIQKAIDAASIEMEAHEQADFFNPPPDPPRTTTELDAADVEEQEEIVSHRPQRRTTPPPPPPRREQDDDAEQEPAAAAAIADQPTAPAVRSSGAMETVHGEEEYESQTFSPAMLSPLSRRPPSGIIDPPAKPPRRDSGLIDVRSMAAAYREYDGLVKKQKEDGRGADVETVPLPILGASDHTSPILLPQQSTPAHPSRWLYALVGVLGLIVVIGSTVAITALVLKHRDGGSKSFAALSPGDRAALCTAEADRVREDEERIAAARRAPASVPGAESEEVASADLAAAPVPQPASSSSSSATPASSAKSDDADDHHHHHHHGEEESSSSSSTTASTTSTSAPSTTAASSAPAATPPAKQPPAATDDLAAAAGSAASASSSDEKCDEVECLVSGKGCCGKNPKGAGAKSDGPAPDPNLPQRPERSDISSGISSVQGRLQSCGDRFSVRGAVTVKISIAPSGDVKSASTSTGTGEFQSCLAGALKGAKFPATQQGARVSYPVMLK
jgi:hypothetical protein